MIFYSLKLKGEDCQKVLTRYKQSLGGIRSKVMSVTKFINRLKMNTVFQSSLTRKINQQYFNIS